MILCIASDPDRPCNQSFCTLDCRKRARPKLIHIRLDGYGGVLRYLDDLQFGCCDHPEIVLQAMVAIASLPWILDTRLKTLEHLAAARMNLLCCLVG